MIHIIIEGADQSGKSTLISNLKNDYENYIVRHFSTPEGESNEEKTINQKTKFLAEWRFVAAVNKMDLIWTDTDVIFWDRSHLGEAVYGPMYRESDSEWIFDDEKLFVSPRQDNVFLFLLEGDIELIQSKDDGMSLSKNLRTHIDQEQKLFREAFNKSNIENKHIIKISNGKNYERKSVIASEVKKHIENARRK